MRYLDSRSLAAFLAVAESLSFRQAAEALHVSQPPLSRTIKQMEARLGVPLFRRDRRSVELTQAGQKLLPRARQILRLTQDAEEAIAKGTERREIRLGLTSAVEHGKRLASLERRCTRAGVAILPSFDASPRLVRSLRAGRLDAAYIALPTEASGLEVVVLERQPMIIALAASHPLARRKRLALAELNGERLLWFERARQPAFFDHCRKVFAKHRFAPRFVKEPLDHHVLLAEVAAARAIAMLPDSFTLLRREGVVFRALREGKELAVSVGLATRAGQMDWLARLSFTKSAL